MVNINTLKQYINYEFSTGCYTGNDYKTFQTKYIISQHTYLFIQKII